MKHLEPYPTETVSTRPVRFFTTQHREQIYPEDLANELVFHYSIPTVQAIGTGAEELGETIASNKWLISCNCVLISRLNPRKATICRASPKEITTVASTEFVPLSTGNYTDDRFLEFVLSTSEVTEYLSAAATSATRSHQRVSPNDITNLKVPWPTSKTRNAIVRFLDRETAEIDAFIADQERLIELFEERRAAVITHVLSKAGRESDKTRLRFVAKVNPPVPASVRSHPDTVITFLPMDAIHELGGFDRSHTRKVKQVEKGYSYFANGDVIYAKVTPCFENGKSAVIESLPHSFGFGTTEVTVLRPQPVLDPKYLLYTLLEDRFRQYGISSMTGAGGLKRVPESAVQDFQIPLPPVSKQRELVGELDRETAAIDAAVGDAQEAIALSRERRAALISAAVTGQIDVTQMSSRESAGEMLEEEVRV